MVRTRELLFVAGIVLLCGCGLYYVYYAASRHRVQQLANGTRYIVHPDLLVTSGIGKGGIGVEAAGGIALLNPPRVTVDQAHWLADTELVMGVEIDGVACAYPRSLLIWHHIVNDIVHERSVTITYCPYTDTAACYDASIHGQRLLFGVAGKVYQGSLVMYDQDTNSYWSMLAGGALLGPMSGRTLAALPCVVMRWVDWRQIHPTTFVIAPNIDNSYYYDIDPYLKLYAHPEHHLYGTLFTDYRHDPTTSVVGVRLEDDVVAYMVEQACRARLLYDRINGIPVVVVAQTEYYTKGASPVFIFDRRVQGKELVFVYKVDHIEDTATHSWWDLQGRAYKGSFAGVTLKRLPCVSTTWFAWSLFYPETRVSKVAV